MNSIYRKRWSENKRIRTANTLKRVHIEGFKRFQRLLRCYQLLAYLMQFISSWCIVTTGVAVSALLASCAWWWSDTLTPFQIILLGALSVSLIIAFIIAIGIPSLLRWMRLTDVTREIEREFPYLEERLTNSIALASVSLPQEGISLALARAAIQDAVAAFARVRWWQPLIRRLRKCARNVIATLSVVAMVALIMFCTGATPNALRATFARAYQEWLFLRVGQLMLKPLPRIVLRGSSVIVHAVALRASPRRVQLLVIDQVTGKRMRRWMDEVDDSKSSYSRHTRALGFEREVPIVATYKTTIRNLEHDVMLFATSGNVRSQAHRIRVVDAPTALRMEIIAEPPAYTGDAPQTWIDPHKPITALKGSWVTVAIEANNPLKVAHLTTADGFKRSMRIHEHNALLRFRLLKSHQLRIAMQDVYGFTGATRWLHIRMRCDQLPRVTIRAPRQRELQVLPTASIPVVVHAVDDYGLNELKVEFRGRVPRRYVELGRYDGDRREATEGLLIHLAGGVRPGDVIKYRGCAIDNDTVSGPKLGTSAWFTIRVVTLRQFLSNLNEFQRYAIERIESIAQRHARLMQELQQFQERWVDATPNERMRMLEQFNKMRKELSNVSGELKQLRDDAQSKIDLAHLNRIASPFDWLPSWLDHLINERLERQRAAMDVTYNKCQRAAHCCKRGSIHAPSRQVMDEQRATQRELERLLKALERAQRLHRLAQLTLEAMRIREAQERVYESLRELMPTEGERIPQGEMKQVAVKVAAREYELAQRAEQLERKLNALAEEWKATGDERSSMRVGEAAKFVQEQQLERRLRQAGETLKSQQLSAGIQNTARALHAARNVEQFLRETHDALRLQTYRTDRDRLVRAWRVVQELMREQRMLLNATKDALSVRSKLKRSMQLATPEGSAPAGIKQLQLNVQPPPLPPFPPEDADREWVSKRPQVRRVGEGTSKRNAGKREGVGAKRSVTLRQLSKEQGELANRVADLQPQLEWLTIAIPQLSPSVMDEAKDAHLRMKQSQGALKDAKLHNSIGHQERAISHLKRIADELATVLQYNYGVATQLAGIAQNEMLDWAQVQERINARTQQLYQRKRASLSEQQLSEAERRELNVMSREEQMIRSGLRRAESMFGAPWSPELRQLVQQAQRDLRYIERALLEERLGEETQARQERVLAVLLRLANELSGTPRSGSMMAQQQGQQGGEQGRRRERNGQGQRVVGKSDEWEDWEDWLRGLPNSIYGRLVEHGPPMKTVPEAIRLRHSTRTGAETMTIMSPSTQPLRISPHISPPALYQDAVSDYYRRIGGD